MDIRDYEYIVSIAEHQSISRAAASLFITQSALTKYLQRTEQQISLPLFNRRGHQLQLTDAGRLYVETGQKIRKLDRELAQKLEEISSSQRRQVRLAFGIGRCNEIFDQILPTFYSLHPDVEVQARIVTSGDSLRLLEQGAIDLSLVVSAECLAGLSYQPVSPSHLVAVVQENSPLLEKASHSGSAPYPSVPLSALAGIPLVLTTPATRSGALARQVLEQFSVPAHIRLEVADTRTMLDAVEGGLGTGILLSVPLGKRKLCYLSIAETDNIQETVSIVWRSDKSLSRPVRDIMELLLDLP